VKSRPDHARTGLIGMIWISGLPCHGVLYFQCRANIQGLIAFGSMKDVSYTRSTKESYSGQTVILDMKATL